MRTSGDRLVIVAEQARCELFAASAAIKRLIALEGQLMLLLHERAQVVS
jgi:hypothetical protein